jgi:hypothetical protein
MTWVSLTPSSRASRKWCRAKRPGRYPCPDNEAGFRDAPREIGAVACRPEIGVPSSYNFPVDESERKQLLRRVETWRAAGELLQRERWTRLRAMTDDDSRKAVAELLTLPYPDLPERGSGLVEQQKVFRRAR